MDFKKYWGIIVLAIIVAIIIVYTQKKKESAYMITGCRGGIIPNPVTGICDNRYSWDQVPNGMYRF